MFPLLPYENEMFLDLFHESGLLVCAKGLGVDRILYHFIKLYCEPHSLVIVINSNPAEAAFIIDQLSLDSISPLPTLVTSEVGTKERENLYKKGGVVFVTSRILVVDLLVDRIPCGLVTGVLVSQAHRTLESGQEAFILRMVKEKQPESFVKAFTDSPVALTTGFSQVSWPYNDAEYCLPTSPLGALSVQVARVMASLFVRKLLVWPRFHASVSACLNQHQQQEGGHCADTTAQVEEVQVAMTPAMSTCQVALLDLIDASLKELARTNPLIDVEELTVEYAITKSFDKLVRLYLDPVWHQLSGQTRQLVADINTLRRLIIQLTVADPVTFLLTVEALRVAEVSANLTSSVRGAPRGGSSWMLLDEANRLFAGARARVFPTAGSSSTGGKGDEAKRTGNAVKPNIELPPKWRALQQVIEEVSNTARTLVLVEDERTAELLTTMMDRGEAAILDDLCSRYTLLKEGSYRGLATAHNKPVWRNKPRKDTSTKTATTQLLNPSTATTSSSLDANPPSLDNLPPLLQPFCHPLVDPLTLILPLHSSSASDYDPATSLPNLLSRYQPATVVLYDPSMQCPMHRVKDSRVPYMQSVRELEVFKAGHPNLPLKVYFLMYTGSVEEQRYLTLLRKEKESFEHLIKERSTLVIPEQRVGCPPSLSSSAVDPVFSSSSSSRQGGDGASLHPSISPQLPTILVDMREFRSELPSLLHRRGFQVTPLTLTVADYILTPDLCVERKSVSDLIGSLNSGRLYSQCVAMTRAYRCPLLLIEFTTAGEASTSSSSYTGGGGGVGRGFRLFSGGQSAVSAQLSANDLLSKLCLLTLHFPGLRLLWTVSPYATAEVFAELKEGRAEASVDTLPQVELTGQTELLATSLSEDSENPVAVDLLMKLPGVSWKNYRSVINKVGCLLDLAEMTENQLYNLLENRDGARQLHSFFHTDTSPDLAKAVTADKGGNKRGGANFKLADRVRRKEPLHTAAKKKKK